MARSLSSRRRSINLPAFASVSVVCFPLLMLPPSLLPVSTAFSSTKLLIHPRIHSCGGVGSRVSFVTTTAARRSLIANGAVSPTPKPPSSRSLLNLGHHHLVFSYRTASPLFATTDTMATPNNEPILLQKRKASDMEGQNDGKIANEEGEEEEDRMDETTIANGEEEEVEEEDAIDDLYPKGIPETNSIIQYAVVPASGFSQSQIREAFSPEEAERLKLRPDDVTVPAAVRMLFPDQFGSQTNARKASRRRKILVHRGPLLEGKGGKDEFDRERLSLGKVGHRVAPGDALAVQTRMEHNYSECKNHDAEPPFHLPVVYQDDHIAVVNKPEGVVVFSHKNGGFGRHNVKSCLPWALDPPRAGVVSVMRRPNPVHRIDRGTSGLLVVAKTKPAMVGLASMFRERRVKKTYTAIVNGDIKEPKETSISSNEAKKLGVCISDEEETPWQIIDDEIEGQSAVTVWRPVRRWPLENARNDTVSLVSLKPKTGRYHQLRRHMAWVSKCPLLGDKSYDGGGLAKTLRDQGFYLCSNKVTLEHPYYNTRTAESRKEWDADKKTILKGADDLEGNFRLTEEDGNVFVHCEISLPAKFSNVEAEMQRDKTK